MILSRIRLDFKDDRYSVIINHRQDGSEQLPPVAAASSRTYKALELQETQSNNSRSTLLEGWADLTLAAGQEIILDSSMTVREAGELVMTSITSYIETDQFELLYTSPPNLTGAPHSWWKLSPGGLRSKKLVPNGEDTNASVSILPRPPKMEIRVVNASRQFYTDERITMEFEVANMEDEETESTLEVRLMSRTVDAPTFTWISATTQPSDEALGNDSVSAPEALPGHVLGRLQPGMKSSQVISFDSPSLATDLVVEAKVLYHLLSDRETPVSKTLSHSISIMSAFEANYEFTPRVHPDPWPTFFGVHSLGRGDVADNDGPREACGMAQRWCLVARIASFAEEGLIVEDVIPVLHRIHGSALCAISPRAEQVEIIAVAPREMHERAFDLDVTKLSLEDRRPTSLSMSLSVKWHRANAPDSQTITSILLMPDMIIPNSEPRVLASAYPSSNPTIPSLIHLDYVLENPTMHFLTFDLTMEASEEFAFSGPKFGAANLLPLSRATVRFNIIPLVAGAWITPALRVMDRYFGKQLKVLGTDGMMTDKKGILSIWVDVDDDER